MRRASVLCPLALLLPLMAAPASAEFVGNTTVVVTSNSNPSQLGEFVTYTATVHGESASPTGTVQFVVTATDLGDPYISPSLPVTPTSDNNSVVTLVDRFKAPWTGFGNVSVAAYFSGNPSNASSPVFTQYVQDTHYYPTMAFLSAQPNPSTEGQDVTFTANIVCQEESLDVCVPTGVVNFYHQGENFVLHWFASAPTQNIANQSLANATLSNLSVGNHTVCANFLGDAPDWRMGLACRRDVRVEPSPSPSPTPLPVLSIGNVSLSENGGSMLFTLTRTGGTGAVTFDYATSDGAVSGTAATGGVDYHPRTGAGAIAAGGSGVFTLSVPIVNEALLEYDEVFTITITSVVGATMASNTAVGTILNDDATPTISISKGAVTEGDSGTTPMTFTVTRNASSDLPVTFNWASAAGTATGGASCGADVDFITGSSSGVIPAGSGVASTTITVLVCGDTLVESPQETLTVTLSNVAGATVDGTGIGVGTINENDLRREAKVDQRSGSALEGNSLTLSVSLNFVPGTTVAVNYVFKSLSQTGPPAIAAPTGGTVCGGVVDYLYATNPTTGLRTQTGTLTFVAGGPLTQTLTIPTCTDAVVDPGELFRFTISQAPGYPALNLGNQVFNGTIN